MTFTELVKQGHRATAPIRLWGDPDAVEDSARQQLHNIAALPWVHGVAVMPDVHYGKGATVGSVIAMQGAVSPAAVGVDIGCGMTAQLTSLTAADLPDNLRKLRANIERDIPVGRGAHKRAVDPDAIKLDIGHWWEFWNGFSDLVKGASSSLKGKAHKQMGTLGGGNHFIEVCLDGQDRVWLMLHSGSRYIGNALAMHHIEKAKQLPHNQDLPDPDLAVFVADTPQMRQYRQDLYWAQEYAKRNRAVMMGLLRGVIRRQFPTVSFEPEISAHHNYVSEETHDGQELLVTRKGAIRAGRGDMGIIPGSMGAASFIVRGLGNGNAYDSASHGAGRKMSRTKARNEFTAEDLRAQTAGVECRKDGGVIDEIPSAYKDIHEVMAAQTDLVEIVAQLKQIVCVKG
ncbi:RtcB family protein [Natronoglycomyces albus]|uniref:3'-phosphate/5'-hydroxy nucleic acid ligase n=1 Tax=Natronoglycomyces albus TaxID=2811108 RepID=A0A895XPE7_9ACTN|nr:RtcB family protein [Natronoglycomyces albus]QSB04396.1 RtcB family protein [Natronoglycomyces albus]